MTTQVKVPKEIQELFIEAEACAVLSNHFASRFIPSLKALYYTVRKLKVESLAWRALKKVFPEVGTSWIYSYQTGMAYAPTPVSSDVDKPPKKTRKPRAAKAVVAVAGPGEKS